MLTPEQETWLAKFADQQIVVETRDQAIAEETRVIAERNIEREQLMADKQAEILQALQDFDKETTTLVTPEIKL